MNLNTIPIQLTQYDVSVETIISHNMQVILGGRFPTGKIDCEEGIRMERWGSGYNPMWKLRKNLNNVQLE